MADPKLVRKRVASNALDLKEFTIEHLRHATGFYPEEIQPAVDALIEEGYIEQRGDGFVLSSDPEKRMELCDEVEEYYRPAGAGGRGEEEDATSPKGVLVFRLLGALTVVLGLVALGHARMVLAEFNVPFLYFALSAFEHLVGFAVIAFGGYIVKKTFE